MDNTTAIDATTAAMDVTTAAMESSTSTNGNTTEAFDVCQDPFLIERVFTFFYLFPLLFIVAMMSFFKVRKLLWPNFLKGRPGVLYPINFIDEYERRWMFVAVLLLLTYRILFLFNGKYYFQFLIPPNVTFVKVFVTMLNVIILCIEYYPMAACIVMRRSMIANVLGVFLTIPWLVVFIVRYGSCPPHEDNTETHEGILEIIYEVPLFISLAGLILGYCYDFYLNIKAWRSRRTSCAHQVRLQNGGISSHMMGLSKMNEEDYHLVYIRELLKRPRSEEKNLTFMEKIKKKFTYVRLAGFKYSPRIICTVAVAMYALYKTAVTFTLEAYFLLDMLVRFLEEGIAAVPSNSNSTSTVKLIGIYANAAKWGLTVCGIASFVIHALLMLHFLIQYRSHIRLFFAGDHSWHFHFESSPANVLIAGMRYSGYQVAYLIYGYIIMTLVLFLILVIIVGFIIIPLATKTRNVIASFFIKQIEKLWPAIIVGLVISYSQVFLAKFAFLQDRGAYVALNNRRMYHVVSFFLFFFNVVLGVFSCLKRIVFSMVFGTLLISRLDRCLLMRGFEKFDTGFKAYLSMLTVDVYHNHPILKGFIHVLQEEVKSRKGPKSVLTYNKDGEVDSAVELDNLVRRRVRNKYWKMLTLINNPTLVLDRMRQDIADARKENKNGVAEMALDSIAAARTMFVTGGSKTAGEKSEVL